MATSSTSSLRSDPAPARRAGAPGAACIALATLLGATASVARGSDAFGVDFTTRPKLIAGTCGVPATPAGPPPENPGRVEVDALVDASGAVITLRVSRSSGSPALDAAVLEAYRHCQFQPAIQNRVPVAGEHVLIHEWTPPSD